MDTENVLLSILTAGLLGAIGQGIRVVIGLKKLSEQATQTNKAVSDLIEPAKLNISLLIGFIAGALAVIAMLDPATGKIAGFDGKALTALIVAGYAGADFIEGFFSKYMSVGTPSVAETTAPAATGQKFIQQSGRLTTTAIVNVRKGKPDKKSEVVETLPKGIDFEYVGWVTDGESVDGNTKWYQDKNGNFIWSGAAR